MSFRIQCPCGTMISLQAEHLGQVVTCPKCSQPMSVQAPATNAPRPQAKPVRQPARPVASPPTAPPATPVPSAIPVTQSPSVHPTAPQPSNRTTQRPAPSDGESYKLQPVKDLPRRRAVLLPGHEEVSSRGRSRRKRKSGGALGWFAGSLFLLTLITVASIFFGPKLFELVRNSIDKSDAEQNDQGQLNGQGRSNQRQPSDQPDRNPVKDGPDEYVSSGNHRNEGLPSFPANPGPNNSNSRAPDESNNRNDFANKREPEIQKRTDTTGAGFIDTTEAGRAFEDDADPAVEKSFDTVSDAIVDLSITNDNRFFAATTDSGDVFVFDYSKLELLYKIDCDKKPIRKTSFSADPCYLCTASELGGLPSVHLRTPKTGESLKSIRKSGYGSPYSISVSPDALSLFVSWGRAKRRDNTRLNDYMDMGIKFWKAESDDDKFDSIDPAPAYGDDIKRRISINSQISSDGKILALGFDDGAISLSDCTQEKLKLLGARDVHTQPVTALAISNSGTSAVSATDDGQLVFTELEKRSLMKTELGDQKTKVLGVAYSPAGKYVAASREGKKIEIFDIGSMSLAHTLDVPSQCSAIKFVNAELIIAGGEDGVVRIFKLP